MQRKTTLLVIVIASLALTGLLMIQLHWIRTAVSLRETYFMKTVSDAMTAVVYKLDKVEAARRIEALKQATSGGEVFVGVDSLMNDSMAMKGPYFEESSVRVTIGNQTLIFSDHGGNSRVIKDVFEEMFRPNTWKPVSATFAPEFIDSLLGIELKDRGIGTKYEFGIYSPFQRALVMQKSGDYSDELLRKGLTVRFSPNNVMREAEFLLLYFPKQTEFILSQMSGLLFGSIMFILVIAFSFYYSIDTIFRQKKLSEMKNDFINNMTHELKTPISTVSLACEVLSDQSVPKDENLLQDYIGIIRQENERLGMMTEKVLQTAVLEKSRLKLRPEPIDLNSLLEEVARNFSLQVEKREGELRLSIESSAPETIINADRLHLSNLFSNLLENALKYSPGKPFIHLATTRNEKHVGISVIDRGIGISKQNQRRIFEKLYRVPTGNVHNVKGFGLGLSYVKAIAELHEGRVEVQSELGQGSTFTVWLPLGG